MSKPIHIEELILESRLSVVGHDRYTGDGDADTGTPRDHRSQES